MINIDVSKVLHPRFWDFVPAFMPGLFFEICILCGRPDVIYQIAARAQLDRYALVVIMVVVAFVIGTALMLWVRLIGVVLTAVYMQGRERWNEAWLKFLQYLLRGKGFPPRPSRFASSKFVNRAFHRALVSPQVLSGVDRAWHKAATKLLKRRYDIDPPNPLHPSEWQAWSAVLGTPRQETFRGVLFVIATQATGWGAVAAAYLAPALRNRPYLALSLFLIAYGILAQWSLVRWWNHPASQLLIRLRAVLDDFPIERVEKQEKPCELRGQNATDSEW